MKNIKKILAILVLTAIFVGVSATASAGITSGDVGQFFGKMFSTGDDSISFTDFENVSVSLDADAGYAEELTASTDLKDFIITIVNWALTFLGLISVLVIIYGGVLYVTSGGEEEKTQTGKKAIQYAVIGILIILGSFAFVNTIIKGATDEQEGLGTTGAAFAGGGFNASSSEVKALAEELFNGYVFLEQSTEELKNIKNDAEKDSLHPDNYPSKADVMKFLNSVEGKLQNIEDKSETFSSTEVAISDLLRFVDKEMLDPINALSDATTYLKINSDGSDATCPPTKEAISDEEGFSQGFIQEFENLSWDEACVEAGYDVNYTPGLYEEWERIIKYFRELSPMTKIDGKTIYETVLEPLAKDYGVSLIRVFARLQEVYNELAIIEAILQGEGSGYYDIMQTQYGYSSSITETEDIQSTVLRESLSSYAQGGLLGDVADWGVDSDIDVSGQHLLAGLEAHAAFFNVLQELLYVKAQLTANVVEGTSPLTVIFDTTGTIDPAGGSIKGSNIYWDIGGSQTTEELFAFTFDSDSSDNLILDDAVTCIQSTESITPDSEPPTEGELIGTTAKRCVFHNPGTYIAAIKVNSNTPNQYAPGISILVIKVKPPKTKIELKAGIGESLADEQVIMHYEDEVLLIDKRQVNFTLGKASEGDGVCFDASGTQANRYQWDFGNGIKSDFSVGAIKECSKYIEAGNYEVTLEVANDLGDIDRKIFVVKVSTIAARLKATPASEAFINETVTLDASGAVSDLGKIKNYEWSIELDKEASNNLSPEIIAEIEDYYDDFNSENSGSDLVKIEHEFPFPGTYKLKVKVTDESNETDEEEMKFIVKSKPPVALFDYEIPETTQPATVHFQASKSYDPDNDDDRMSFQWSIEPDSWECIAKNCGDLSDFDQEDPIIKFQETGDYEVTLKVESYGETNEIKKTIEINNILDIEWGEDQETTAQLDNDGEARVDFILISEEATEYEIDFGDGDVTSGEFPQGGNSAEVSHTYTESGAHMVTAKVYDEQYNDNSIKRRMFIGDGKNPIAKITLRVNGVEYADLSESIQVTRKDILTLDASESKNIDGTGKDLGFSWDYGSGKSASKSFTHSYDDTGNYTIELEVFDKEDPSLKNSDSIQMNVVAVSPTFSSIQAIPESTNPELITPVNVNMKVYGDKDEDGDIVQYKWWYFDMNDPDEPMGIQLTQNPLAKVTIGTNGKEGEKIIYGFGLEITDTDNMKVSSTHILDAERTPTIEVTNGPNELPTAKFSVNTTSTFTGDEVTFSSSSSDSDGTIVSYIWDFEGDGFGNDEPTENPTIKYAYTEKNLQGYDVKLKVIDDKGGEVISDPITIYVDSTAKQPTASFEYQVIEGSSGMKIQFTNTSEVDEEAGAKILSDKWDFDTNSQLATADSDGDGIKDNDTDSQLENPQRLYTSDGVYDVKLTITDSQGNVDEFTQTITIPILEPLTTEPIPEPDDTPSDLVSVLLSDPIPDLNDGYVYLSGDSGSVTFDFSQSQGSVAYYIFDKNINFDTDGNGIKNDDQDFKTSLPGTWKTNFEKEWGKIVVKLTVTDIYGNEDSTTQEIKFQ